MIRFCFLIACSLTFLGTKTVFAETALSAKAEKAKAALKGIDAVIEQALKDFDVPGLSIGIVVDGQTVWTKGYGVRDLEGGQPVTENTLFAIGSCTKAFTTFAFGTLVEEGLLHWDVPVIDVLPEFRLWDQYATQYLTIRDLLTHRSGLPRHDFMWYNSTHSRQELLKRVRYLEPTCNIRERYNYGNLSYLIGGLAMEQVKGKTWEEIISEKILRPLEMHATNFSIEEMQKSSDFASPHLERQGVLKKIPFRDVSSIGPAACINSNVVEMNSWMKMLLAQGAYGDHLLTSPASLQEMFAAQVIVSGYVENKDVHFNAYGLGWCIHSYRGHYSVSHDGAPDGFTSVVTLLPYDDLGIVILSNKNLVNLPRYLSLVIVDRILELPAREWLKEGLEQWKSARQAEVEEKQNEDLQCKKGTLPSHPLEEYVGQYDHPGYGTLDVLLNNGKLEAILNAIPCHLDHCHYDVFSLVDDDADLLISRKGMKFAFQNNAQGEVDELSVPFEPKAPPIVFRKKPSEKFSNLAYFKPLLGSYSIYNITVEFMIRDGRLIAIIPGQPIYELIPTADHEFGVKSMLEYTIRFLKDETGEVTQVLLISPYGAYTATRKK